MTAEERKTQILFKSGAAAALCLVVAGVITAKVNLPLNAIFKSWQASTVPADWQRLRSRWRAWNIARTFLAVAAFVCTSVAIVTLS